MVISNRHKFIFVHIHKTGGTSVTQELEPVLTWEDIVCGGTEYGYQFMQVWGKKWGLGKHAQAEEIRKVIGKERWDSYLTFAFVRHPVNRIRSLYKYSRDVVRRRGWRRWIGEYVPGGLRRALPWYQDDIWRWPTVKAFLATDSFSEYIRHSAFRKSPAAQPQTDFLMGSKGQEIIVDFVGKTESLSADLQKVADLVGVDIGVPGRSNQSPEHGVDVSREDRDLLVSRYQEDFETFGYERRDTGTQH